MTVSRFIHVTANYFVNLWLGNIPLYTCTPVLIAALFTIARTWKPPKCPVTEKWIKEVRYLHIHQAELTTTF